MSVTQRHLHGLMAEEFADRSKRRATHHQPRRKRVAQVVPPEVFEARRRQGGVEALLEIPRRRAQAGAGLVGEHEGRAGVGSPQALQHAVGRRVERHRMRSPALGVGHADDVIEPVDPTPFEAEEIAAAQARVDGEFDGLAKMRGPLYSVGCIQQAPILRFREVAQSLGVGPKELHAPHGVVDREALLDCPIKETPQHLQVAIDAALLHLLGACQLDGLDHCRRDASKERLAGNAGRPHLQRGHDVGLVARHLRFRVCAVQGDRRSERDDARRALVPRTFVEPSLCCRPRALCFALAPKALPATAAIRVADLNQPPVDAGLPHRSPREVSGSAVVVHES